MVAPFDSTDARGLMKAAIRDPDPVVVLENEIMYGQSFPVTPQVLDADFTIPLNKAKVSQLLSAITFCEVLYCLKLFIVL